MKPLKLVVIILLIILLSGCGNSMYKDGEGSTLKREMEYRSLGIVTDKETGCQYILAIDAGITPRVDVNGKVLGCRTQ